MKRLVVVLAAGLGTRMKSPRAKVLHPLLGRPLLAHLLEALPRLKPSRIFVVAGHQRDEVAPLAEAFGAVPVIQEPQLGTGHALSLCRGPLEAEGEAEVLVVPGDAPLLPMEELARFWDGFTASRLPAAVVSMVLPEPENYGRVLRQGERLRAIREAKDCSPEERAIPEVNTGVYFLRSPEVFSLLSAIGRDNAQREYYLTDLFALLYREGRPAVLFRTSDPEAFLGINSQRELARANARLRASLVEAWMDAGVTVLDPGTTWIEPAVRLAPGVLLHPFVRLQGMTHLEEGVEVRSFSVLSDTEVGAGTLVKEHCVLEKTAVGPRCIVGPFSRTREGTVLGEGVHLGNFVETKKAALGRGVKANHLSYLGDATVGAGSNIGAGTITCNYDGEKKHRTVLGERVFVGSDTQLVAPVTVGDGAYIGAGTTVTQAVPPGALAVSRVPQRNIEGWVARKKKGPKAPEASSPPEGNPGS